MSNEKENILNYTYISIRKIYSRLKLMVKLSNGL